MEESDGNKVEIKSLMGIAQVAIPGKGDTF